MEPGLREYGDRRTVGRLVRYAVRYKYKIAAAIVILMIAVALELAGPLVGKAIIDGYLAADSYSGMSFAPVLQLIGLYMGLLLAAGLCHFVQSLMLQTTALRIVKDMRLDVMNHLQRLPIRFFDNSPTGRLVNRIANDTEAIRDLYMSFMATFIVSLAQITGIFVFLFILDAKLAAFCLLLLPVFATIVIVLLTVAKKYWVAMRTRISDMNTMLSESIMVMPVLQLFRREKQTIEEFEQLNAEWQVNNNKQVRLNSLLSRNLIGLIGALLTAGVVWYFGGQSLQRSIEFGVLYAFVEYIGRFFHPVIAIFDQLVNAQRAQVSAERVFELLDEPGEPEREPSALLAGKPEGHVRFDNVWFAYNGEEHVLKGISFEAMKGQTVALVGHTGSGKSSIMNLLLGFYEAQRGLLTVDRRDVRDMAKQELREHMAVVLQDPFLFAGDIKFNVSLYNSDIGEEEVRAALQAVGADTFVDRLPAGIDEPVIERGSTLSAGQRQLITFARALAYDPSILILDEATASVDSETEGLIQHALQVLSRGRTTFVIAHRLSTIREADLILVLHKGEIVERGSHDELMAAKGRYYKMYELQHGAVSA